MVLVVVVGLVALAAVSGLAWWAMRPNGQATNQESNQSATDEKATTTGKPASTAPQQSTPTPTPTPEEKATVNIEAAIIYNMGGAQPVAREHFYLLDTDLEAILRTAKVQKSGNIDLIGSFGFLAQYPEINRAAYTNAMSGIKKHAAYSVETDFKGKGQFQNVKPGLYYLFGMTETRGGFAIWNLRTKVESGEDSVTLDNKNAVTAF